MTGVHFFQVDNGTFYLQKTNQTIYVQNLYRVTLVVDYLGCGLTFIWMFRNLPHLLSQFCQTPSCLSRVWQTVEPQIQSQPNPSRRPPEAPCILLEFSEAVWENVLPCLWGKHVSKWLSKCVSKYALEWKEVCQWHPVLSMIVHSWGDFMIKCWVRWWHVAENRSQVFCLVASKNWKLGWQTDELLLL